MIDLRAIIGNYNQSVDVRCQKSSLSLLLICLFLFRFGEASKTMVPTGKKIQMAGSLVLGPLLYIAAHLLATGRAAISES